MNRDDNFELDPEFTENFSKNIEKVLNDATLDIGNPIEIENILENIGEESPDEENGNNEEAASIEVTEEEDASIEATEEEAANREDADDRTGDNTVVQEQAGNDKTIQDQAGYDAADRDMAGDDAASQEHASEDEQVSDKANEDEQASDKAGEDEYASEIISDEASGDGTELTGQGTGEEPDDPEREVDEVLADINEMLARQISDELGTAKDENEMDDKKGQKSRKVLTGWLIALGCVAVIACFLGFTKPGHKLLLKAGISLGGKIWGAYTKDIDKNPVINDYDEIVPDKEDLESDSVEIDPDTIVWPEHKENGIPEGRQEDYVYNILLLGEENIKSEGAPGRTDVMVIATLNTKQKSIKLTSIMRDTLVQIPGHKENRINAVYEMGGLDLLYKTIALNFDIKINGCMLVNFENFEKIIDKIGGLDITLTAAEAKYLNRTNYISKPQYRNVVEGKQHMNGNQVLGYARIRKRAAITGNNNDYGRTDRHRIILNAIFDKYKSKSKLELVSIMFSMLPLIETDINDKNFEYLLDAFLETGADKIEQLRIPANGTFTENVKVRGLDVLIPDLEKNTKLLHEFIFGDYKG